VDGTFLNIIFRKFNYWDVLIFLKFLTIVLAVGWRGSGFWARVLTVDHREGEGDSGSDARDSEQAEVLRRQEEDVT